MAMIPSRPFGVAVAIVLGGLVAAGIIYGAQRGPRSAAVSSAEAVASPLATVAGVQANETVVTLADHDPVVGDPAAPVTLVEFIDLQCPYCREFHQEIMPQLQRDYVATGIVKIVFKDFPLTHEHPEAHAAAIAANCAAAQGRYLEVITAIFDRQADLAGMVWTDFAREAGLDVAEFTDCQSNPVIAEHITEDIQMGVTAGVAATPSFLLQGELYEGVLDYAFMTHILNAARPL